jgi:hypothetical protein
MSLMNMPINLMIHTKQKKIKQIMIAKTMTTMTNKKATVHHAKLAHRHNSHGLTVLALSLALLALSLVFPYSSSKAEVDSSITNCPTGVIGACTPGTFESSTSTVTETSESSGTGTTTITTTTTDTETTTISNQDTGDLLTDQKVQAMGRNQRFGGDMSSDWGGQGPASMPTGSTCGGLGTDRCAQITGSGTITSTLGQTGIGTTFIQTIDMTNATIDPDIDRGGKTTWSIKVEKRDSSDSIHFRVKKSNGTAAILLGTQTLSAAGSTDAATATLFSGSFDFSGAMTQLVIEVSGRDINLSIGPLFDDVSVNVIYNVVSTIVQQTITTIEQFVAFGNFDQETIDVATDIFENNDITSDPITGDINIQQPETDTSTEVSYESVEAEMQTDIELPTAELTVANANFVDTTSVEAPQTIETVAASVETEIQTDIEASIQAELPAPEAAPVETVEVEPTTTETANTETETQAEPVAETTDANATEEAPAEETTTAEAAEEKPVVAKAEKKEEPKETKSKAVEKKAEPKKVAKAEPKKVKKVSAKEKRQKAKEKAAKKIVKKMGDKGKYETGNQLKTLVIMQVLGNTKEFFSGATVLPDAPTFYKPTIIPDATIPNNNAAQYLMFGGSSQGHDALINMQYN